MLLKAGADPTLKTLETTVNEKSKNSALTPLELAKDENIRALLTVAVEEKQRALDAVDEEDEASERRKDDAESRAASAGKDEV